jgi:hypothetical protein
MPAAPAQLLATPFLGKRDRPGARLPLRWQLLQLVCYSLALPALLSYGKGALCGRKHSKCVLMLMVMRPECSL